MMNSNCINRGHCRRITRASLQCAFGFTLIEMAMVMLILSILVAASIAPLAQQMQQKSETETKAALEAADAAIVGFAAVNGRLPCPDTGNDGVEDPNAVGICASLVAADAADATGSRTGLLPFSTLGVTGVDAWGNRIRYSLDVRLAAANRFQNINAANLVVNNGGFTPVVTATNNAAYVLWSAGRNGLEGGVVARRTFVSRIQTDATVPAGLYDDILIFKSSVSLAAKMSAAGQWP
jgi:prepilin-type N-terminal cleavage/methylation domain-containing protein